MQRALAVHEAGADPLAVVAELREFLRRPDDELGDEEYRFLVVAADVAFTAGCYAEAQELYDLLVARDRGGHGARLRQVHARILRGEAEDALRLLDEFAGHPEKGLNDDKLRALALVALERFDAAAEQLRSVVLQSPGDPTFARLLVTSLRRAGAADQLDDVGHLLGALPAEDRLELLLSARLARGDAIGFGRLYAEFAPELADRASDAVAAILHELLREQREEQAVALLEALGADPIPTPKLAAAASGVFLGRGDWIQAARWISLVDPTVDDDLLRLRRLQLHCFTLELERAEAVLAEWGGPAEVPQIATGCAATLYAALGQWENVMELLEDRVSHGLRLFNELLEIVALAVRATGRYNEVFDLLEKAAEQDSPASVELCDRLAVEVSLLAALGTVTGRDDQGSAQPIRTKLYDDRAALYSRLLATGPSAAQPSRRRPSTVRQQGAIVLCADHRYMLGTCVAVSSLLAHNPGVTRRHRVLVVCSEDAIDLAGAALGEISAAASEQVEVIGADEVLPVGGVDGLRTGWGCFTPGHALSDAAYYRLFAVRHLLETGLGSRALYLDSDTCLGRRIEELWGFDLAAQPLGARFELRLQPIEQAARKLGLEVGSYFNSGVLLFDLEHAELPERLDAAIEISVREPEKLTFLDQCALNVAFAGRLTPLEERHNFYVRPGDKVDGRLKPVVRHFLTRWKPWDPTYPGGNSEPWLRELTELGGVVSRETLRRLLAAQFSAVGPAASLLTEPAPV